MRLRFLPALLLCALALLLPGGVALAAQQDTALVGGDYDYLATPPGGGFSWCEEQCNNDARCRAWTFLKSSGQCRLKRFAAPSQSDSCCTSGVKAKITAPTQRDLCADYANNAVDDQQTNLAQQCGLRGDGWSEDYKLHFRACLDMSPAKRSDLARARELSLKRCDGGKHKVDGDCQRFAALADAVATAGREHDCGLARTPWSASHAAAYDWCLNNRSDANEDALTASRAQLVACLGRGGGRFLERCDGYAREAVSQFETARKTECGFRSGSRWSDSYSAHYQWCMKADEIGARNERADRQIELDRCLADSGGSKEGKVACDHYARLASEQTQTNRKLDCGLTGRRWLADYDRQYAWCIATSKANRLQELKYREEELDKCFQRGGGASDGACDDYASSAVVQYQQSLEGSCHYRGADWHDSYIGHYRWCLAAKPGDAQKRQARRKQALETCRLGVRLPLGRR
jgi:hypothetical protein